MQIVAVTLLVAVRVMQRRHMKRQRRDDSDSKPAKAVKVEDAAAAAAAPPPVVAAADAAAAAAAAADVKVKVEPVAAVHATAAKVSDDDSDDDMSVGGGGGAAAGAGHAFGAGAGAGGHRAPLKCPYLDTINRPLLDFDFEKVCSVSLSNHNVYGCLVCGKFFQGRGRHTHAYTHSVHFGHHVFINLATAKVYCLPGAAAASPFDRCEQVRGASTRALPAPWRPSLWSCVCVTPLCPRGMHRCTRLGITARTLRLTAWRTSLQTCMRSSTRR